MPRKGQRKKIAKGIYEDRTGRAAVCLGKEKRFPPFTPIAIMRAWQDTIRKKYKAIMPFTKPVLFRTDGAR